MMLHLTEGTQISNFHFEGTVRAEELKEVLKDYPFEEEVIEKAKIHRKNMEQGIVPFSVTLRLEPDCGYKEQNDGVEFEFENLEVRDGKSKAAAITMLSTEQATGEVMVRIFLTTKEKMERLERNQC